jgi:IQ calmodulin-binding motif
MTPQTMNRKSVDNTSTSERLMLQDAFSSLSLADKCALSVSLNPNFVSSRKLISASGSIGSWDSPGGRSSSPSLRETNQVHEEVLLEESSLFFPHEGLKNVPKLEVLTSSSFFGERARADSGNRSSAVYGSIKTPSAAAAKAEELNLESMGMRSVISESDKESLDVAMSMMRQQELDQVEDEVRKIQNNVRGWLLRKNYVNLRDAAKTLQVAWRGKRRLTGTGALPSDKEHTHTERLGQDCAGLGASKQLSDLQSSRDGVVGDNGRAEYTNHCERNCTISMTTSPCPSPLPFTSRVEAMPLLFASPDLSGTDMTATMGGTGDGTVCVSSVRDPLNVHSSSISVQRPTSATLSSSSLSLATPITSSAPPSSSTSCHMNADLRELNAAATLQTAARALPARKKSFAHAKRQAMASLVIQKSFLQWRVKREQTSEDDKKDSDVK